MFQKEGVCLESSGNIEEAKRGFNGMNKAAGDEDREVVMRPEG